MIHEKTQRIDSIKEGDLISDPFVVKIKRSLLPYKEKPGLFGTLILSDSSGKSISCKLWGGENDEETQKIYEPIKQDDIILVIGRCEKYKDELQISINDISSLRILSSEEYRKEDFIKISSKNLDELFGQLLQFVQKIQDLHLKNLVNSFLEDEQIGKNFKEHPGAIEIHHNWVGGLLEHTLELLEYCELTSKLFPELNKDLLIAGAILHDIGKLEEIEVTTRIKGSERGQLKGHISIGFDMVSQKIKELSVPSEVGDKILHIILSHHGTNEFGSPREPMFPEAVAIYYADELSSKTRELIDFVNEHKEATEDAFMYHYKKGHNIFLR